MQTLSIAAATTRAGFERAWEVVRELRTHLALEAFVAQVERQREHDGYTLVLLSDGGIARSAAGFRRMETLAWGRILYVDDLVTRAADRGAGYGSALLDWLVAEARTAGCMQFHLDSGVQRFGAHRFYLHKGLDITSHHFALAL
ncbi:MAG: GNAT family N-acetyltransferase [Steroidobacteraceae bacterium]